MIVYKATNNQNGKCYIGQTKKSLKWRKTKHTQDTKRDKFHFHNALKKYNFDFTWEIIEECVSNDDLNMKEIYYIKKYDSMENGYNTQPGGQGTPLGFNKGSKNGMYGRKHSKESIEKMKRNRSGKCMGDDNPTFGTTRPDYIKQAVSNANKGRIPWNKGLKNNEI